MVAVWVLVLPGSRNSASVITFSKEVGDLHFTSFFIVHLLKQSKMKLHPKAVNKAMTNNKMDMGPRNQIATTHGKKLMFLSNQKPRLHWSNLAKIPEYAKSRGVFPAIKRHLPAMLEYQRVIIQVSPVVPNILEWKSNKTAHMTQQFTGSKSTQVSPDLGKTHVL